MIWNYSDKSELKMKDFSDKELSEYLEKIKTETLISMASMIENRIKVFDYIKGDLNSIMGLPIKHVINYIRNYKND